MCVAAMLRTAKRSRVFRELAAFFHFIRRQRRQSDPTTAAQFPERIDVSIEPSLLRVMPPPEFEHFFQMAKVVTHFSGELANLFNIRWRFSRLSGFARYIDQRSAQIAPAQWRQQPILCFSPAQGDEAFLATSFQHRLTSVN